MLLQETQQHRRRSRSSHSSRDNEEDRFLVDSGSGTAKARNGLCLLPCDSSLTIHPLESAGQHSDTNAAAYFLWPGSTRLNDTAEERALHFGGLQKELDSEAIARLPIGQQATTLLDLMTIRAFHSKILRRYSLGTAVGFRMRKGSLTDIPAILVFVARKVHKKWLLECQVLPSTLEAGPGGVWCDVDVVEFSYYTSSVATPKEQVYTELVEGLRGSDQCIGPGSQVASQETYGTLGTIVRSRTGSRQVGFLTNRHVAVDLDYPNQKMFHPLPPNLGPGVYLGAVERATSFITDELWYDIFASTNPETFVRADGAFVPFADSFDLANVTTRVKGVGDMGEVMRVNLQAPIGSLIGKSVVKVGRSSGLTKGTILAYALEYNDEKGICFFTDFLVVGENRQAFDLEGDSGSVILICRDHGEKPQPVGIIWGGTANRGRLKLKDGAGPENWTSAVDLGRLLDLLQLDLLTTDESIQVPLNNDTVYREAEAVDEERRCTSNTATDPTVEEPPSPRGCTTSTTLLSGKSKVDGCPTLHFDDMSNFGSHCPTIQTGGADMDVLFKQSDFITRLAEPSTSVEHQFMQDFHVSLGQPSQSRNQTSENLSGLKDGCNDDISIGLQLGDHCTKKRRTVL